MKRLPALGLLAAVGLPGLAWGQTNDHFYRSWRWTREAVAARAAGLAGAMAAVDDDAGAAQANPAALGGLPKVEILGGLVQRSSARSTIGDRLASRTDLGQVAVAGSLSSRWAFGAYFAPSRAERVRLEPLPLAGFVDQGFLEARVTQGGLGLAWRLAHGLHAGATLALNRLSVDGEYSRDTPSGQTDLRVGTSGEVTHVAAQLGLLYGTGRLRLGLVHDRGTDWNAERTALNPALGVVLDPGSRYVVRRPGALSLGACLRPSLRLLLAAQLDRVRYQEIASGLVIGQGAHSRSDYLLTDAWEPRLGVEASFPQPRFSIQVRGGVHWMAPGSLRYTGPDVGEQMAFVGSERRARIALGGSLVTARWFRFDLTARVGGRPRDVIAGLAVRL